MIEYGIRLCVLNENTTFAELHVLTSKHLMFVTSNMDTGAAEYFDHKSHPSVRIGDAMYMSMSLPALFKPMRLNGHLHIDGCMTCVIPQKFPACETLYILMDSSKNQPGNDMTSYIHGLMKFNFNLQHIYNPTPVMNSIVVCTKERATELYVTPEKVSMLIQSGYASVFTLLYRPVTQLVVSVAQYLIAAYSTSELISNLWPSGENAMTEQEM